MATEAISCNKCTTGGGVDNGRLCLCADREYMGKLWTFLNFAVILKLL